MRLRKSALKQIGTFDCLENRQMLTLTVTALTFSAHTAVCL